MSRCTVCDQSLGTAGCFTVGCKGNPSVLWCEPTVGMYGKRGNELTEIEGLRVDLAKARAAACTPEERAVLDAMAKAPDSFIRSMYESCEGPAVWVAWMKGVLEAELARRAAKGGKT